MTLDTPPQTPPPSHHTEAGYSNEPMHKDRQDGAATVLSGAGNGDQETLRMSRNVHGAGGI